MTDLIITIAVLSFGIFVALLCFIGANASKEFMDDLLRKIFKVPKK